MISLILENTGIYNIIIEIKILGKIWTHKRIILR